MAESTLSSRLDAFSGALRQKVSIPHQVAHFVHELIAAGELNPGDRIVESRLARGLSVGHPTIREALVLLEHQGLVERRANQGCFVTKLTREQVTNILEVRSLLETSAVEWAVQRASREQLKLLRTVAGRMKTAGKAGDVEEFYRQDLLFHQTLWKASGNPYLERALAGLMLPLLAFCMLKNLRKHDYLDMPHSADAHRELAEAVASRDRQEAKRTAREQFAMFAKQHTAGFQDD